jgi:hypothetical protein
VPIGVEKEAHKSCPFKQATGNQAQEVGRSMTPREMCTHNCALYDEAEQACSFRVMAERIKKPLHFVLQSAGAAEETVASAAE